MILLHEESSGNSINLYKDDETGDIYYYNGKKLIKIKNDPKPTIGSRGDADEEAEEKARHDAEVAKEREESPEDFENEETEEEKEARIARIKDFLSDEGTGEEVKKETEQIRDKELAKIKASKEAQHFSSSIQRFSDSLRRFVKDQIKRIRNKSWKVSNSRYEGSGIIKQGTRKEQNRAIPLINVYFDQSGSWGPDDIKLGEEAIGVLNNYVKRGEIKINVYFFANDIHENPEAARAEGGTGAGARLMEHIVATHPTNVIVMTDDDFDSWGDINGAPNYVAPGAVWFLFRGRESKLLQEHLKGKAQTSKYFI